MRKLKLKEVKLFARGPVARKWQSWDLNSGPWSKLAVSEKPGLSNSELCVSPGTAASCCPPPATPGGCSGHACWPPWVGALLGLLGDTMEGTIRSSDSIE